jgi:hypothetical protein
VALLVDLVAPEHYNVIFFTSVAAISPLAGPF